MKNLLLAAVPFVAVSLVCQAVGNDDALAIKYSLPQFGHYVTPQGAVRDKLPADIREASTYRLRSVEELIQEWFSSCLDNSGVQPVTKDAVEAWKAANYVPVEKKHRHIREAGQIDHIASVVAYLAVEYQAYGLNVKNFKTCMGYVNRLAKDSWTLGILGGKLTISTYRAKARNTYKTGMMKIDDEIRVLMLPLEEIHKKEFAKWASANPQQYAELKKNDDTLEHNIMMQAKIDENTEAARRAEARAAAAERAARDAEAAARDAEAAAYRARFRR